MSVRMAASPVIIGLIVKYVGVLGTQKLNCWLLIFKMARYNIARGGKMSKNRNSMTFEDVNIKDLRFSFNVRLVKQNRIFGA